jgi:LacI family transcriptional regulator
VSDIHPRRPTLKDVARVAGVSVTTAQVALADRREGVRVPEATRERVRQAAEKLGYQPNILARSLKTRRTSTIGFISDQVTTTPFAVSMLAAAQDEAARHGYLLFVVNMDGHGPANAHRRAIDLLLQQRVAGVIYGCMYHRNVVPPPRLPSRTVFANAAPIGGGYAGIVPDDRQGAHDAVAELAAAGHRRIAFLDDEWSPPASALRLRGYLDALAEADVEADPRWHLPALPSVRGGLEIGGFLDLPADVRPTAIFCFNDRQAMGAYRVARHRGLTIPDDLSVVGFDDQEFIASDLEPPLTTVQLPHAAMGKLAVQLLVDDGDQGAVDTAELIRVPCTLIRRQSVSRAPSGDARARDAVAASQPHRRARRAR